MDLRHGVLLSLSSGFIFVPLLEVRVLFEFVSNGSFVFFCWRLLDNVQTHFAPVYKDTLDKYRVPSSNSEAICVVLPRLIRLAVFGM